MKHYKEYDKDSIRTIIESGLKRDLHMHTCYSDGVLTPHELIDLKAGQGYQLLAITDHDGAEGSAIGMEYAEKNGISFISGIEFDTSDELGKDLHMLGYGFEYSNKEFSDVLLDIRLKRARRNDRLLDVLNEMGYGITLDDIGKINDGRYVGKPTFARILRDKGYLENPNDAFSGIFRDDRVRAIKKETLSSLEAIELIHRAGGLAVMAHPMEQRHMNESFEDYLPRMYQILDRMREYGIDGIECIHPSASEEQRELLMDYADKYGLMITEGSDIHDPQVVRDYSRYHKA